MRACPIVSHTYKQAPGNGLVPLVPASISSEDKFRGGSEGSRSGGNRISPVILRVDPPVPDRGRVGSACSNRN